MRAENVLKNSIVGFITSIISIFAVFLSRVIFTHYIDSVYLGYNALFTSIISILSITELGVSTAISYRLYKPISNKDDDELRKLLSLFKRFYYFIATGILGLGLVVSFFIQFFIKEGVVNQQQLQFLFILFLINIVIGYLNTHKRSFLFALQSNRTVQIIDSISKVLMLITQLFVLMQTKSYALYLIINIIYTAVSNILISFACDKKYNVGKINVFGIVDKDISKSVFKDIKNAFLIKISSVAVQSSDSLIISSFVSNLLVGFYSNYQLVISAINTVSLAIIEGITAPLGDMINNEEEISYDVIRSFIFICFIIASFCSIELIVLFQKFIILFFGEKFLLDKIIVVLAVISFFLQFLREPLWAMISLRGKFKFYSKLAISEAVLNLVLSLIFVQFYGFTGVLLATVICRVYGFFTQYYTCEVNVLGREFRTWYIKNNLFYIFFFAVCCILFSLISNFLFNTITLFWILVEAIFIFIAFSCICVVVFKKKEEFTFLMSYALRLLRINKN